MYKYVIEVQLRRGTWVQDAIWACHPSNFHALLNHFTDSLGPVVRIKRTADELRAEFQWPIG